jgi:hypothetical protein
MSKDFPLVGVIAPHYLYRALIGPALALGVDLRLLGSDISTIAQKLPGCDVVTVLSVDFPIPAVRTIEAEGVAFRPNSTALAAMASRFPPPPIFDAGAKYIEILVARSPHAQASVWAPAELVFRDGIQRIASAPAVGFSGDSLATAQSEALAIVKEMDLVGVVSVRFKRNASGLELVHLSLGPSLAGNWTVGGSRTDQYEQHLRAILDLPLGDPQLTGEFAIAGNFMASEGRDMYRPYLHLMARSPSLKYHQYRDVDAGFGGHINCIGDNLLDLTETMWHALEYMDGEIDE